MKLYFLKINHQITKQCNLNSEQICINFDKKYVAQVEEELLHENNNNVYLVPSNVNVYQIPDDNIHQIEAAPLNDDDIMLASESSIDNHGEIDEDEFFDAENDTQENEGQQIEEEVDVNLPRRSTRPNFACF